MLLSPGEKLGPYEIIAPIGAGGMGEVYRAHDPRLGRDVAINEEQAFRVLFKLTRSQRLSSDGLSSGHQFRSDAVVGGKSSLHSGFQNRTVALRVVG
jgi:serine/threonine protein kinase